MKTFLCSLLAVLAITMSACSNKADNTQISEPTVVATTVSTEKLQSELNELNEKYENIIKIYDQSLKDSINTYCEEYLSYSGSATDNVEKIKDIVTENYYSELQSQTGHQKSDDDYEQSTGVENLYYSDCSSPSDTTDVMAHCKQTIIFDDEVKTLEAYYIFEMIFENGIWKINSVSNNS